MSSIFEGFDSLIMEALSLEAGQSLKQKSACASLAHSPDFQSRIEKLVFSLFSKIESNWIERIPSAMNWKLRRQGDISPQNKSPEVLLERAIVILADRGILKDWFNQLPIASGLIDEYSDKRAAVDLVHVSNDEAELIELKWASDTPAHAAFEIVRYGLVFLFCHMKQEGFSYHTYPLMKVKKLSLRVLAPHEYYSFCNLGFLGNALDIALQHLFREKTQGALSADFMFLSFPPQFVLPFHLGAEVATLRELPVDAPPIAELLAAMNNCRVMWQGERTVPL